MTVYILIGKDGIYINDAIVDSLEETLNFTTSYWISNEKLYCETLYLNKVYLRNEAKKAIQGINDFDILKCEIKDLTKHKNIFDDYKTAEIVDFEKVENTQLYHIKDEIQKIRVYKDDFLGEIKYSYTKSKTGFIEVAIEFDSRELFIGFNVKFDDTIENVDKKAVKYMQKASKVLQEVDINEIKKYLISQYDRSIKDYWDSEEIQIEISKEDFGKSMALGYLMIEKDNECIFTFDLYYMYTVEVVYKDGKLIEAEFK